MSRNQRGFSLPETLFALLFFATGLLALLEYQRILSQALERQWQQRQALLMAEQRLLGFETVGWQTTRYSESGPSGCQFDTVRVTGPFAATATLRLLACQ